MSDFNYGDPVKINRPGRKEHTWLGRYIEPIEAVPGRPFGWVAFNKKDRMTLPPAEYDKLRRQDDYPRSFFPLSQIEKHESPESSQAR